jgi:hypothetical protein
LWARALLDEGRPREALQQIALARHDASDRMDEARLEAAAGRAMLADGASGAAAERLANALRLFGGADAEPWRGERDQAAFALAEALYFAARHTEAEKLFAELRQQKPEEPRASMSRLRLAELARARGEKLPDLPGHGVNDAAPSEYWPNAAWSMEAHLLWLQKNEKRFGDEPVWENLP